MPQLETLVVCAEHCVSVRIIILCWRGPQTTSSRKTPYPPRHTHISIQIICHLAEYYQRKTNYSPPREPLIFKTAKSNISTTTVRMRERFPDEGMSWGGSRVRFSSWHGSMLKKIVGIGLLFVQLVFNMTVNVSQIDWNSELCNLPTLVALCGWPVTRPALRESVRNLVIATSNFI